MRARAETGQASEEQGAGKRREWATSLKRSAIQQQAHTPGACRVLSCRATATGSACTPANSSAYMTLSLLPPLQCTGHVQSSTVANSSGSYSPATSGVKSADSDACRLPGRSVRLPVVRGRSCTSKTRGRLQPGHGGASGGAGCCEVATMGWPLRS